MAFRRSAYLEVRPAVAMSQAGLPLKERNTRNVERYRTRNKDIYRANKRTLQRAYTLKHKFGLTIETYNEMLESQNLACAICETAPCGTDTHRKAKNLAVDHDHTTKKVRGLLCDLCNRALGQFQDSPVLLRRAAEYIEKSQ